MVLYRCGVSLALGRVRRGARPGEALAPPLFRGKQPIAVAGMPEGSEGYSIDLNHFFTDSQLMTEPECGII
jgi:hypothetical protein